MFIVFFVCFAMGYTVFSVVGNLVWDIPMSTASVFFAGASVTTLLSIIANGGRNGKTRKG